MIVGFQVLLIGLLADVISGNRKLLEDLLYRVRSLELPQPTSRRPRRATHAGRRRSRSVGALIGRSGQRLGRHPGATTKRRRSATSSPCCARAAPWHEIIVVDDGSTDDTGDARARPPARPSCAIPYNKGNGAAVKSGIRRATGEYVLIIDGDGQHPPEDALRLVARLGEYDLVIGARSAATQATQARRAGNARAQLAGQLSDRARRFRTSRRDSAARARARPARVPAPAAERLLDADDDDAGVHQGGLQRRVRADRGAAARRATRRSGWRATARSS